MHKPRRRTIVAQLAAAFAVAGIASIHAPPAVRAHGKSETHIVRITKFVFAPNRLEVHPGDVIRWVNGDIVPHTATALDGSWDTGEIEPGGSGEITVSDKMSAAYFCRFHPMMKASLRIV